MPDRPRESFPDMPPPAQRLESPHTTSGTGRAGETMAGTKSNAFITARKGFCYLTVKLGRRNAHVMRIRNYTLEAQDKRDMRRLYPDVVFDWKKITRQLAENREACRRYRSRRRHPATARPAIGGGAFHAAYDPSTRTVYADGVPSHAGGAAALLDAILQIDRELKHAQPPYRTRETTRQRNRDLPWEKNAPALADPPRRSEATQTAKQRRGRGGLFPPPGFGGTLIGGL